MPNTARKTVSFGEKLQCSLAAAALVRKVCFPAGLPRPLRAEVPLRLTLSTVLDPRSETLSRIVGIYQRQSEEVSMKKKWKFTKKAACKAARFLSLLITLFVLQWKCRG